MKINEQMLQNMNEKELNDLAEKIQRNNYYGFNQLLLVN